MSPSLVGAWAFLMVAPPPVAATFVQIAPVGVNGAHLFRRTPERFRAVVLVHGLRPHPFRDSPVLQTDLSLWEEPGSPLVRVFAFSLFAGIDVWRVPISWTQKTWREVIRGIRSGAHKELEAGGGAEMAALPPPGPR